MQSKAKTTIHDFEDGNGPIPAHQHPNGGGWVSDTARVEDICFVGKEARVSGKAQISGKVCVSITPIIVVGLLWPVVISDAHIQIGCEAHKTDDWRRFKDSRINLMDVLAPEFWNQWKAAILEMAVTHQSNIKRRT